MNLLILLFAALQVSTISADANSDLYRGVSLRDDTAVDRALSAGADVFAPYIDTYGKVKTEFSTFSQATSNGNLYGLKAILNKVTKPTQDQKRLFSYALAWIRPPGKRRSDGHMPSEEVRQADMVAMAKALIKAGADVNHENGLPLKEQSLRGHVKVVRLLLAHKAKITDSAIVGAASNEDGEILSILLRAGGNPNAVNSEGTSAVFAAVGSKVDALKLLIQKNANLDKPNAEGITPLNEAIYNNHWEAAQLLRAAGAKETPAPKWYISAHKKIQGSAGARDRVCLSYAPNGSLVCTTADPKSLICEGDKNWRGPGRCAMYQGKKVHDLSEKDWADLKWVYNYEIEKRNAPPIKQGESKVEKCIGKCAEKKCKRESPGTYQESWTLASRCGYGCKQECQYNPDAYR